MDKMFDELLEKRSVPAMRSNLEYRITQESLRVTPKVQQTNRLEDFIRAFSDALLIPKPAVVMGLVLVCGVFLGLYSGDFEALGAADEFDVLFMVEDEMIYGDFL